MIRQLLGTNSYLKWRAQSSLVAVVRLRVLGSVCVSKTDDLSYFRPLSVAASLGLSLS